LGCACSRPLRYLLLYLLVFKVATVFSYCCSSTISIGSVNYVCFVTLLVFLQAIISKQTLV
jgi:hypothetical protein